MSSTIAKWGTIIFVGFIFMGVLLHASQFSEAAGTVTTGTVDVGKTLEGR